MGLYFAGAGGGLLAESLPGEFQERRTADDVSLHICGLVLSVRDDTAEFPLRCHLHEVGVALVEEEQAVMSLEEIVQFSFRAFHALEAAESLQVGTAHVGDQSAGGLHVLDELLYVPGMGCSHLDDGDFVLGADAEQRTRHADIVVVVRLGMVYVEFL